MSTTRWRSGAPMPSYTSLLAIGHYTVTIKRSLNHRPTLMAYEQGGGALMRRARTDVRQTPRVLGYLHGLLGGYPFASAGALVDRQDGGYYLPEATRPTYMLGLWTDPPDLPFLTPAMNASQWYGVSVSPSRWNDAWLMQGMQEFAGWRWSQVIGQGPPNHYSAPRMRSTPRRAQSGGPLPSIRAGHWSSGSNLEPP